MILKKLFKKRINPKKIQIGNTSLLQFSYCGYDTIFSEGTSLISSLKYYGDIYESLLVKKISESIINSKTGLFIDVGSNIGLISLSILQSHPNIKIEAFEPGPHQNYLFSQTIAINNLSEKIHLNSFALGDRNGKTDFCVHESEHASGDGLFDTGRAGPSSKIIVDIKKMDDWWSESGNPPISVIKIDSEGAELLILMGAEEILIKEKPVLFIEIFEENIFPYGYSVEELIIWLMGKKFVLYTLSGHLVNISNYSEHLKTNKMFMARYEDEISSIS